MIQCKRSNASHFMILRYKTPSRDSTYYLQRKNSQAYIFWFRPKFYFHSCKYKISNYRHQKKKKTLLLLGTHYCSFFRLMQKTTGVGITKSAIQHIPSRPLQSKRQRLKPRNSTKIPRFSQPVQSHLVAILNRTYCYSSWTGSFWSHSERCFSTHTKSCMHDGFFPHLYSIEAAEFGPALNIMHSL